METAKTEKKSLTPKEVQLTVNRYEKRFEIKPLPVQIKQQEQAELTQEYYNLVTDFYLHGWGKMFHFGVMKKGDTLHQALLRHEFYLAEKLNLKPGEKCLDLGCGVAGPMMNIAKHSGADITGINNCGYQLEKAKQFIWQEGLEKQCHVLEYNWMNIPMPSASFDKAYAIEATCHAAEKRTELFTEIHRLLKPGGLFTGYDWVMTRNYEPGNAEHEAIKLGIEIGDAISNLNYESDVKTALVQAGFEVLEMRDMVKDCDPETPWYLPLKGSGFSFQTFRASPVGRRLMQGMLWLLENVRLVPKGTSQVHKILLKAADALVKGGEKEIFTPMLFFLARKI